MGYRSDVQIVIYGPESAMAAFIAAERLKQNSILMEDAGYVTQFRGNKVDYSGKEESTVGIHAVFEGVKWYSGYRDVDAWTALVGTAEENDNLCVEFVRIGEHDDDIETTYHGDDCRYYLSVYRRIESDIPDSIEETEESNA